MTKPSTVLTLENSEALQAALRQWYTAVKRDLPWRQSNNLYGIWVSEIMLQQTTVQAVIPFWLRFMEQFPTVQDLARAAESEVLAMWSGLGYYSRARNLHAAARLICSAGNGDLPRTRDEWIALPGIGPYASGAIASIGLQERVPALDANARRVLQRWAVSEPPNFAALPAATQQRQVDELGAALVPAENPGDWNQALMELGALVCGARRTDCAECPVRRHCRARLGEWVAEVPPPKKAAATEPVWLAQLLVTWRDRVLLVPPSSAPVPTTVAGHAVAREDFSGLHHGLWGLPMTPWLRGGAEPVWPDVTWQSWLDLPPRLWVKGQGFSRLGDFRHAITRYRLRVAVLHLSLDSRQEMPAKRLGSETIWGGFSKALPGLFFALKSTRPPVSKLTDKGLHFQQDTVV